MIFCVIWILIGSESGSAAHRFFGGTGRYGADPKVVPCVASEPALTFPPQGVQKQILLEFVFCNENPRLALKPEI
jgi:hypothetical protein